MVFKIYFTRKSLVLKIIGFKDQKLKTTKITGFENYRI